MELLESRLIDISKLIGNTGQIEGVAKNPRFIKGEKFEKLKASIAADNAHLLSNELKVYEYKGKFVVLSGNMRLRACKELGIKKIPCKILPQDWTIEQLQKEIIVSNVEAGEWDVDILANEWDDLPLVEWGVDAVPDVKNDFCDEEETQEDNTKTACSTCPTCGQTVTGEAPF